MWSAIFFARSGFALPVRMHKLAVSKAILIKSSKSLHLNYCSKRTGSAHSSLLTVYHRMRKKDIFPFILLILFYACSLVALVMPALNDRLAGARNRELALRCRLRDGRASCDVGIILDRHRSDEVGVAADEG